MGGEQGSRGDMNDTCHFRITNCLKVESCFPKTLCQMLKVRGRLECKSFLRGSQLLATERFLILETPDVLHLPHRQHHCHMWTRARHLLQHKL